LRHIALPLLLLTLAACSKAENPTGEEGKFAGLEPQIVAWRDAIEAESPHCKVKAEGGKGCQDFAVACKRERAITPEEQARGVTAKLVAAVTFNSRAADAKPGSAFAEFTRANGAWTRTETGPVNMGTCEAATGATPG
jgi:hypothetical protein